MDNYTAWKIDPNDFPREKSQEDRLKFLINFTVLAPSSHNSQPWKFEIKKNAIHIMPDLERALPASDTNHRQLFISLGCALENILVAADYYNLDAQTAFDDSRLTISFQKRVPPTGQGKNHLIFSIPTRHTNRSPYTDQMPEQSFLDRTSSLTSDDVGVHLVLDTSKKECDRRCDP